jgi:hypothetical protein
MIVGLTLRYKLPMIGQSREFPRDGSLMSYGIDLNDQYREAAVYAARRLRSRPRNSTAL